MNSPNLLLHINILHNIQPLIPPLHRRPIIALLGPLPPRKFLFRNRLTGYAVKEIAALGCQAFEIVGYVGGGEVGCAVPGVGFRFLLFPAGVEEFNWG
jgi:hypothetical protein